MAVYPERAPSLNGWQIAGQALTQAGGLVGEFNDQLARQRAAYEDMVQKRAAAILAKEKADREAKQAEEEDKRKQWEFEQKQKASTEAQKFKDEIKRGKALSPTAASNPSIYQVSQPGGLPTQAQLDALEADAPPLPGGMLPEQSVRSGGASRGMMDQVIQSAADSGGYVPYNQQERADLALEYGQITPKDYLSETKPKPDRKQVQEINGRKVMVDLDTGDMKDLGPVTNKPTRDRFTINEINGRKVRVNLDTGEMMDLGAVTPKTLNAKDKNTVNSKITQLELAQKQLDNVKAAFDNIKGGLSTGAFGQGALATPGGKAFDAAVDAFRQTATALTRVPGVGAMSDYETRLTQSAIPSRRNYESVTQQQIDQMQQLIDTMKKGYGSMAAEDQGADEGGDTGGGQVQSPAPRAPTASGTKPTREQKKADALRRKYNY